MDKAQILYSLIELFIFCVPVGGLIWKAAKQAGRLEELEKDLNGLGKKVEGISEHSREEIKEISNKLNNLSNDMRGIATALEYIKKSIDEARK